MCGLIDMKLAQLASQNRHRTNCTVKVVLAKLRKSGQCGTRLANCDYCPMMNNDLVRMTSWDLRAGIRACIPKFSSNPHNFITDSFEKHCFHHIDAEVDPA